MANTNPEHECGDVNTPHDGWLVSSDAKAVVELNLPTNGSNA
jgi:hypothetical protein